MIILLIVSGIVLFAVGIFFLVNGLLDSSPRDGGAPLAGRTADLTATMALELQTIKTDLKEAKESETKLKAQLDDLKKNLKDQRDQMGQQLAALDKEKNVLTEEKAKNLALVEQLKRDMEKIEEELKTKNRDLQTQWEASLAKIGSLENDLSSKKKAEEDLQKATTVQNLESEKEALLKAKNEAETQLQKIQETHVIFQKKEEMLHYEVTKSRAQAFGLEKLCEDFKSKIEMHLQEIRNLKEENHSFHQLYEETLKDLEAMKASYEELSKKEQLSHSELERNRAQLLDLEKVYSDFRAKLENVALSNQKATEQREMETRG